jgi:hypothetical protein
MVILKYSGNIVFNKILPLLIENKQWLFWKESQISLALTVASFFKNKAHLTKDGLIQLINILYDAPNNYTKPKDFFCKLIEEQKLKIKKD